jgi:hypothetical protein
MLQALHTTILTEIVESPDATFDTLVRISRLDPRVDFRFANLRKVDFRNADLRGFDFTGSDLLGAVKNENTQIDSTTILESARIGWIEADSTRVIDRMLEIQNAVSSKNRRKLLEVLVEENLSSKHIRQFLVTSMRQSQSIEAFFDFANAVIESREDSVRSVIIDELTRIVDLKGRGPKKGRSSVGQTPYGMALVVRKLEEASNRTLIEVGQRLFALSQNPSRSDLLSVLQGF